MPCILGTQPSLKQQFCNTWRMLSKTMLIPRKMILDLRQMAPFTKIEIPTILTFESQSHNRLNPTSIASHRSMYKLLQLSFHIFLLLVIHGEDITYEFVYHCW